LFICIVPNGRRDHFDQNAHFNNLVNHLAPAARAIAKRCRDSSIERKLTRDYQLAAESVKEHIALLKQGVLGPTKRKRAEIDAREALGVMEKSRTKLTHMDGETPPLSPSVEALSRKLQLALGATSAEGESPLARLPSKKRAMYEHLFDLIYESSVNRSAAKSLIDRILLKIV
jgi:molecular chaperone HtpG